MMNSRGSILLGISLVWLLTDSPVQGEVLFERKVSKEVLDRYEIKVNNYRPGPLTPEELKAKIERGISNAAKDPGIIKVELLYDPSDGNPYFRMTSLGLDKIKTAASQAWFQEARRRYGIEGSVGKTKPDGSFQGGRQTTAYLFFEGVEEVGIFIQYFKGPVDQGMSATFYEVPEREIDHHQFLRSLIRAKECDFEKRSFGYVVETRECMDQANSEIGRVRISWLYGPHLMIHIVSLGKLPSDFVEAYGKRFPSTLPRDLKIDKTAWGREEARFWLERLQRSAREPDPEGSAGRFYRELMQFREYIFVPELQVNIQQSMTLEEKQTVLDGLNAWWREHGEETYWYEGIQQLAAKGLAPEELERQAKEREERRIEAILDAPIGEEKLEELEKRVIEKLEKEFAEWVETNNRGLPEGEWRARFEKKEEGFVYTRKESDGALTSWTYTGPEIKRLSDRRRPLRAVFTESVHERSRKKVSRTKRTYTYDKLEDRWFRS